MLQIFKKKNKNRPKEVNKKSLTKKGFLGLKKLKSLDKGPNESVDNDIYPLSEDFVNLDSHLARQEFIKTLQYRLVKVTALRKSFLADFEKLYKGAYFISNSKREPKWLEFYDLLFVGESRAIIFSKFNTSVGPLLNIEDIMNADLKINFLNSIFFKLEFLINQMIKIYNEGKNRNYHFRDSINDLKYLGLISEKLYDRLLFIASIRSKIGRAWSINEIKFPINNNKVERLHNKQFEFKALLSESYVDLIEIYMRVQKPYLRKFSLLWSDKKLFIGDPISFYYM